MGPITIVLIGTTKTSNDVTAKTKKLLMELNINQICLADLKLGNSPEPHHLILYGVRGAVVTPRDHISGITTGVNIKRTAVGLSTIKQVG